jgi:hypothetical protein
VPSVVFDGPLNGVFQPVLPLLMHGERIVYDFEFVTAAAANPEWYLEFTSENPNLPATRWKRETAEEDIGMGVTHMPNVVRDFPAPVVSGMGMSNHFVRAHHFVRIQVRTAAGSVGRVIISAPFGTVPQSGSP